MDAETERLIERTRQRRELLNQKMGKTPEAAPRKRRTPLSEDQTDNVGEETNQTVDDSPKRQCVRGSEQDIKPDTPAIPSVKSRLQNLARQHVPFSEDFGSAGDKEESAPVPTPRKSISSPPPARAKATDCDTRENTQPSTGRKGRFAQLAQIVSNWEDDLSHPTIVKEEEKKPRWQPPKPADTPSTVQQVNTPKKTRAPLPPSSSDSSTTPTPPSPQKAATISSAEISSPTKLSAKMSFNSSPRPYMPYSERTNKVSPVKSPASSKSNLAKCSEAQKAIQPNDNKVVASALNKTPRTAAKAPSDRPMSARLANWEQKISETKPDVAATPKSGLAASSAVSHTLRQACTPARPLGTPARLLGTPARPLSTPIHKTEDMQVQMRPKVRKSIDDEPTAHPVSARKSAWEQMSSAQVISDIKKVKPGDCTPVRPMMPAASRQTPGKVTSATPSLEPKKSFKDSIKEKAAEVNPSSATRASATQRLSPKKASEAMKSVQEQLVQKTQSTDMAERLRQERMVELQAIQNRWKNGILNERGDEDEETATEQPNAAPTTTNNRREVNKERARADFDSKLASLGFDVLENQTQKQSGLYPKLPAAEGAHNGSGHLYPSLAAPKAPPLPSTSASNVTGKPPRPKTLFNIVSLQKKDAKTSPAISAPPPVGTSAIKVCRKVKFDDSFESDDSVALAKKQEVEHNNKPVTGIKEDISEQSDTTQDDSESGVVFRQPHPAAEKLRYPTDDDDLSLSAFVPESVRRQSILPSPNQKSGQNLDTSFGSLDSFEGAAGAPPDMHKSTTNLVRLGQQYGDSSSSLDSSYERPTRAKPNLDDTEDSLNGRDAIDDLLEEAMDSDSAVPSTSTKESPVQMRKRPSHRKATEKGSLPFSVDEYRASRNMQVLEVKQVITRNSLYVGMDLREEEVEMPTIPVPAPRQNIQERVKELQELVQHEQNIIMQTSNALNQCCSSSSHFAGSQEQVECNRLLLISCQKRQSFMAEIQRLRDSRKLDEDGPGPKGSLTISDIRLPLKKEFVTRIGTYHDTTTYYFILLIRNGPQVICTQMLSTHDPMMRGSLDFPNLIKINGITGNFRVELEIYSMSVSKESLGKDKKKKTPKKVKGSTLTVQSPGGPMAVRTTSFSQVTTIQLTMRSLDKHSFNLDRLSHLSPLHGTIYMNLKCIMEAHIEERGFLTMFEDVSGLGSWHRRWCVLSGNKLQYWKYPDDESRRDPIGYIDLKRCTTEKVGLISRDICARPNTFELELARQPRKGERDTLVSRTYDTMTTVRHMLSADTKEERIVWCNKLNRALANIRTWHCDALRPAKLPHVKSCY